MMQFRDTHKKPQRHSINKLFFLRLWNLTKAWELKYACESVTSTDVDTSHIFLLHTHIHTALNSVPLNTFYLTITRTHWHSDRCLGGNLSSVSCLRIHQSLDWMSWGSNCRSSEATGNIWASFTLRWSKFSAFKKISKSKNKDERHCEGLA